MSQNHIKLNARRWACTRKLALKRSGFRSEISGKPGRLECHHRVPLELGGDPYSLDNIIVVTRDEHIRHHRPDDMTPGRAEWLAYLEKLI